MLAKFLMYFYRTKGLLKIKETHQNIGGDGEIRRPIGNQEPEPLELNERWCWPYILLTHTQAGHQTKFNHNLPQITSLALKSQDLITREVSLKIRSLSPKEYSSKN